MGISTVRLKGGKPWRLGPQAQADLLAWGSSEKPASGPKPASRSEEAGGQRGPAPLDTSFSSSFSRVCCGVCEDWRAPR